jgi:hypothetical protein
MYISPRIALFIFSAAFVLPTGAAAQPGTPVPAPVSFAPVAVSPPPQVTEESGFPFRTAIGFEALVSNTTLTTGSFNTASGYQALRNNTNGSFNTAAGYQALFSNIDGGGNTAVGYRALMSFTTGIGNTAVGNGALAVNTASVNTATGSLALNSNTTGTSNIANGYRALRSNTTANQNTAVGFFALDANTTGESNTATGYRALELNQTGSQNVAIGGTALSKTTGNNNVALGWGAGIDVTTGSDNILIGVNVGSASDTQTIRIGRPGTCGLCQNRTFIAGIYDSPPTGTARLVYIDQFGQLGALAQSVLTGSGSVSPLVEQRLAAQQDRIRDQDAVIADLSARLARLETLMAKTRAK